MTSRQSPTITTRDQYLDLFDNRPQAMAFEEQVLQSGFDNLPPEAHAVLVGDAEPSPAYWSFLAGQLAQVQREAN